MARIAITGGRDHAPGAAEMRAFERLWKRHGGTVLLSGMCNEETADAQAPRGVDAHLLMWARQRGVTVEPYRADWPTHGKAAGPIRNAQMVASADLLIVLT